MGPGTEIRVADRAAGWARLVAERNHTTVGSVVLAWDEDRPEAPGVPVLRNLFVEPPWRNAGVGTALVSAVERLAAESGSARLLLDVEGANADASRLYRRLGYLPVGPPRRYEFTQVDDGGGSRPVQVSSQSWVKVLRPP